mgnify:CR=1 FL=1
MNYYQEYCKLFVANVVLTNQVLPLYSNHPIDISYHQIKELIAEKNELLARVAKLESGGAVPERQTSQPIAPKKKEDSGSAAKPQDDFQDKKKRFRRTASEIEKHFQCPVATCGKAYGYSFDFPTKMLTRHTRIGPKVP